MVKGQGEEGVECATVAKSASQELVHLHMQGLVILHYGLWKTRIGVKDVPIFSVPMPFLCAKVQFPHEGPALNNLACN